MVGRGWHVLYILTELVCKPFLVNVDMYVELMRSYFLSFEPENRDVLQHNGWIDH